MAASRDEACLGFNIDAPNTLDTNFYLMLGDDAYGLTFSNLDRDAYFLEVDLGSSYTINSYDSTLLSFPVNTAFDVYSPNGVYLGSSVDYRLYSSVTFTAFYSTYIISVRSSGTGYYGLRAENN